jgi:signal peptidase II
MEETYLFDRTPQMKKQFIKFILLFLILVAGCSADLHTKQLAINHLKDSAAVTIVNGFIEISYIENKGMVFGVLGNKESFLKNYILTGLTCILILFVFYVIWRIRNHPFFYHLPFIMILSGAFGNVIDRIRFGHVVDFIHIHWKDTLDWPFLFNCADLLITIGEILLLGLFIFQKDIFRRVIFQETSKEDLI